jgi:xylulokinase
MAARTLLLGVDVGSGSIRAEVFLATGQSLGQARRAHHPHQPIPGVAEYDPEAMTAAVVSCLRELATRCAIRPGETAGLALDGMISGVMGVDADWVPTTPYTTPLDMRYGDTLNTILARHERRIREVTGSGMAVIGPKIAWIKAAFPEAFARTRKFVTATGFIAGKLAGLRSAGAFVDFTYLWSTGLSDTLQYRWSDELCAAHGIRQEILPRIVKPTAIVGHLTQAMGRETGLGAGVPIVAGAGDQSAGFVGAGLNRPGMMADVAGTYPIFALCTDRFVPDLEARRIELFPSPIAGQFHACQIINGGGLTHTWIAREMGGATDEAALAEVFASLDAKAATLAPGCDGLLCSPHLGGRVCPAHTAMRGVWLGFTWTHRKEHFHRAFLEAIAFEHALALHVLRNLHPGLPAPELRGFGGGAKSVLWNQIKADVLGMPYRALDKVDQATWGDAVLIGAAVGLFDDIARAAEQGWQAGATIQPNAANHLAYQEILATYQAVSPSLEDACERLRKP